MFSYYKREYAQTVLSLLTALEGVMLSFYGYSIGSNARKPNIPDLINQIKNTPSHFPAGNPMAIGHDMYREHSCDFWRSGFTGTPVSRISPCRF